MLTVVSIRPCMEAPTRYDVRYNTCGISATTGVLEYAGVEDPLTPVRSALSDVEAGDFKRASRAVLECAVAKPNALIKVFTTEPLAHSSGRGVRYRACALFHRIWVTSIAAPGAAADLVQAFGRHCLQMGSRAMCRPSIQYLPLGGPRGDAHQFSVRPPHGKGMICANAPDRWAADGKQVPHSLRDALTDQRIEFQKALRNRVKPGVLPSNWHVGPAFDLLTDCLEAFLPLYKIAQDFEPKQRDRVWSILREALHYLDGVFWPRKRGKTCARQLNNPPEVYEEMECLEQGWAYFETRVEHLERIHGEFPNDGGDPWDCRASSCKKLLRCRRTLRSVLVAYARRYCGEPQPPRRLEDRLPLWMLQTGPDNPEVSEFCKLMAQGDPRETMLPSALHVADRPEGEEWAMVWRGGLWSANTSTYYEAYA